MNPAGDIWTALLELYEQERRPYDGMPEPRGWLLTRGSDDRWRSERSCEALEWSVSEDVITCDLSNPMPQAVAVEIGFFARYLELL